MKRSVLLAALLVLFMADTPAWAGEPGRTNVIVGGIVFGGRQSRSDPATAAILQQILQNQQTIIALLQQQRQPTPAQPLIVMTPPVQNIPLGGPPRQEIPLGGPPHQDIPLGGPPRQEVPLGPPPVQNIPLGPPPKQELAPAPPKQAIPLGEAKPAPAVMQRFVPATWKP